MASSSKPRQPRLRASCDGCFLAKVKCSKARPICSRCLSLGIDCKYSPSSRAGKPKSDNSGHHSSSAAHEMNGTSPIASEKNLAYSTHQPGMPGMYVKQETGWHTPTSVDGNMSRNHSISSGLSKLVVDEWADPAAAGGELYSGNMPWTPPNDMVSASYAESPLAAPLPSHARSASYDVSMSNSVTWADPSMAEYYVYSQSQMPTPGSMASNHFPSPSATPNLRPSAGKHRSSSGSSGHHASCTCFTVCLQSLQALHNASSPASPPFDLVLSLNRKAVEGCATMLACSRCMSRSGTHTAAMLLATVIGKITSFYKNASQSYFESGGGGSSMAAASSSAAPGLSVSIGAYQIQGEDGRWLETEILWRELRKLEEVHARFREVCGELSEDPDVSRAMIGYLGHTLGSTLDVVNHRKGDMSYG